MWQQHQYHIWLCQIDSTLGWSVVVLMQYHCITTLGQQQFEGEYHQDYPRFQVKFVPFIPHHIESCQPKNPLMYCSDQ